MTAGSYTNRVSTMEEHMKAIGGGCILSIKVSDCYREGQPPQEQ